MCCLLLIDALCIVCRSLFVVRCRPLVASSRSWFVVCRLLLDTCCLLLVVACWLFLVVACYCLPFVVCPLMCAVVVCCLLFEVR